MQIDKTNLLECVEVETAPDPRYSVIWLHGLGADGNDFKPIIQYLALGNAAVRFVFPHAPIRPVTLNNGMRMRAWYDLAGINLRRDQDEQGIKDSAAAVASLIEREESRGIDSQRIILAGFSQGGAIALYLGTRYPKKLLGIMALSTYLLFPEQLEQERHAANQDTSVFAGHGTMDPMVPFSMGEGAVHELKRLGYAVSWNRYPVAHSVAPEEVADIGSWLRQRFEEQT